MPQYVRFILYSLAFYYAFFLLFDLGFDSVFPIKMDIERLKDSLLGKIDDCMARKESIRVCRSCDICVICLYIMLYAFFILFLKWLNLQCFTDEFTNDRRPNLNIDSELAPSTSPADH